MIIYSESDHYADEYKAPVRIDPDFIHSKTVAVKRPITTLHNISSENCEFLKTLGLTLNKKKKKNVEI